MRFCIASLVALLAAMFSACGNSRKADSPWGNAIPESTPVLATAYVNGWGERLYAYPSRDSLVVEVRNLMDSLAVIGGQGEWLEVKVRTRHSDLANNGFGKELSEEQVERLYIAREDVWLREKLLLSESDLRNPQLAYSLHGHRLKTPREVPADSLARVELISEEEYLAAWEQRVIADERPWHPDVRRVEELLLVPITATQYALVYSPDEVMAGELETSKTLALIDSLERIPGALVRRTSWVVEQAADTCPVGEFHEEEEAKSPDAPLVCCYYMGEQPKSNLATLLIETESATGFESFINRKTGNLECALAHLGETLPYIAPDTSYMVGVGIKWFESKAVVLSYVLLSENDSRLATELCFPYMQFLFLDDGECPIFGTESGAMYARVISKRASNFSSPALAQYVRITAF